MKKMVTRFVRLSKGWLVRRLVLGAGTLLFAAFALAQSETVSVSADTVRYSLEGTVHRALDASPEVAAETARKTAAQARSDLAGASRILTDFSLTSAHSAAPALSNPNGTPTDRLYLDPDVRNDWDRLGMFNRFEINALQPIYTWGELTGNIRAARHAVDAEAAAVRETEINVAYRAAESYYSLLLAEALTRVAADAGDVVVRAKREINRLLDEGAPDVDDADLFEVLITEQEFERRVVEVDERLRTAEMALRRQLFLPDSVRVAAEDAFLEPVEIGPRTLEQYMNLALSHRPEIHRATAGIQARDAMVSVARSDFLPKLFLAGRYRVSTAPNRFDQPNPFVSEPLIGSSVEAGLGLRWQLNFVQTRAKVERARAQRNEVAFQREGLQQLIRFEVEESFRRLRIAQAAMEAQQEALRLSREWLQLESVNFDLDLGDTENLVRAVRSNIELQAAEYQAVFEYNVAVLKLLRSCGILITEIESGMLVGN